MTADTRVDEGPSLVRSIQRYRYPIILAVLLAVSAVFLLSRLQTPVYEARSRLYLADPAAEGVFREGSRIDPVRYIPQQAELMTSRAVLQRAAELLDRSVTANELERRIAVTPEVELDLLEVAARSRSPEDAAAMSNAMAQAYQEIVSERATDDAEAAIRGLEGAREALQEQIEDTEDQLAVSPNDFVLTSRLDALGNQMLDLEARAQQFSVDAAVFGTGVDFEETAEVPENPASPRPARDAALAGILVAGLAAAAAYARAGRRPRVEHPTDPARVLGAPLLGEIPPFSLRRAGRGLGELPEPAADAYQFLLASTEFALDEHGGRSVLLTSASQGDGKTTTALRLALAAAGNGRSVVLADGDLRARGLTEMVDASDAPGLTDCGELGLSPEEALRRFELGDGVALPVLPAGLEVPDPPSFFRTSGYRRTVAEITKRAELLFIDCSPLIAVADASLAAQEVDGVLLVVDSGTSIAALEELRRRLTFVSTPLLGYVFNRSRSEATAHYGYAPPSRPSGRGSHLRDGNARGQDSGGKALASGEASRSPEPEEQRRLSG